MPSQTPPPTQPHCPTCRTVLADVDLLAVLQGLGEHMQDLLALAELIAEATGVPLEECLEDASST